MINIMNIGTKISSSVYISLNLRYSNLTRKTLILAILLLYLYYHRSTDLIVIIGLFHCHFAFKLPLNNKENMHLYCYSYYT